MRAMVLDRARTPLVRREVAPPEPGPHDVLLEVRACGVCRTDLHVVDGELPDPRLPLVLGHEVVGTVIARGSHVDRIAIGARVGVPWLAWTCGECRFCRSGRENLCPKAEFTGYHRNGGYAERMIADERYCFPIPDAYSDVDAAPLLCAGLIGFRALRKAGDARTIGLYGFGAAAHLVAQVAVHQGRRVLAFTRPGDVAAQRFARSLGAEWAGDSTESAPAPLDAALIFAPVGPLVPAALRATVPGGIVVCAGIHMSDIPSFPYDWLWQERSIVSVANLTRDDGEAFFALAPSVPVRAEVVRFPLDEANDALAQLRAGAFQGAAVLVP